MCDVCEMQGENGGIYIRCRPRYYSSGWSSSTQEDSARKRSIINVHELEKKTSYVKTNRAYKAKEIIKKKKKSFTTHYIEINTFISTFYLNTFVLYIAVSLADVLQMMGRAGRPQFDDQGKAVILVHDIKKDFYKKFLYEPFPVESR